MLKTFFSEFPNHFRPNILIWFESGEKGGQSISLNFLHKIEVHLLSNDILHYPFADEYPKSKNLDKNI